MSFWDGTRWAGEPAASPAPPSRARRILGATVEAGLITLLMFGLIAGSTFAAKGGGRGGGGGSHGGDSSASLNLVMVDASDTTANFGDQVTFDVSTTATSQPWVTVTCSQGGSVVYHASNGIFATSLGQVFTLGPTPAWQAGGADCTASLEDWDSYSKNGKIQTLKSMSFHVYA